VHVTVIGSGVVGASIADALAGRGASVTVLDMRGPGQGASQAAAGMLAPYSEAHDRPALLELTAKSLTLFDDLVAGLRETTRRPLEYVRTGTLDVALDESGAADLRERAAQLTAMGVACDWLDAPAVLDRDPSVTPAAIGGLFVGTHGFIGARAFVEALVDRARLRGAIFERGVEAVRVESRAESAVVHTHGGPYEADWVVLAAGSWSRRVRVANVAVLPVRPMRGQLLHLAWQGADPPRQIVWGPHCYTVPWSDGSLLVGATMEDAGFEECATVQGVASLTSAVSELLPAAAAARFDAVRVGLRPALPDGLPAIGPMARAPRVMVASGHFRNGVLLAPLTADLVSRLILDGDRDPLLAVTSPDRFEGRA
jgi:glycine oxidase